MDGEHYFSAQPVSEAHERTIRVVLQGETFALRTADGVFSAEHLDTGTAVLLATVPPPATEGDLLDLGCGWGPIAIAMARRSPGASVWAVDVNERALALAAANARIAGVQVKTAWPQDIPDTTRFATIWSNPPIRIGKAALHELLETWLPRLAPGGTAWLVVAKQLGGDSLQRWIAERFPDLDVSRAATDKGFRVLEVSRD
ncbi:class I SAM-dependent methyltransferase [Amnibacterium kyonggiense]|uniref:16S rRNA m(2)G 1207 methyltransferase n=1 Tax=Amnibacterium kyonggiense TaxID=595671 RepID=A0A4R7FIX2_9MICO|nr:methyltransferase [Amnibacterium kyonggiense]TDS75602.1 16S rRNA m(2)G 1207 methyltransferase [Amnibacterium kyonggiense]